MRLHLPGRAKRERERALQQLRQEIRAFFAPVGEGKPLLLIAHEISPSGASMLLLAIAERLVMRGYRIILMVNLGGNLWQEGIQALPEAVKVIPCAPGSEETDVRMSAMYDAGVRWCIANTVVGGAFFPALAAHGIRAVSLIHEMSASCGILHAEPLVRAICEHAAHVVFPAALVMESCLGFAGTKPRGEIHILPQGIYKNMPDDPRTVEETRRAIRVRYGLPEDTWLMIGAGAINFGKGVDLLIPVLCELRRREAASGRQTHVLWMGQPRGEAYEYWLKAQIRAAGLEDRWHWCGFIGDDETYARHLRGSDVYAMVSREDSFPAVITEAIQMELPIVAFSGSGGGAELLEERDWGYIVPSGDIAAYCDRLQWLRQHGEEAAARAGRAKEEAGECFVFDAYVDRLLSFMSEET